LEMEMEMERWSERMEDEIAGKVRRVSLFI
jgi:hypothetical protein